MLRPVRRYVATLAVESRSSAYDTDITQQFEVRIHCGSAHMIAHLFKTPNHIGSRKAIRKLQRRFKNPGALARVAHLMGI